MKSFFRRHLKELEKDLGPGIITGASDDDPSGIMTYLLTGARTGLGLIWVSFLSIPLMVAVQEMCARIGLATKRGLAGNMRDLFSPFILYPLVILIFAANTFNIAADLSGMAGALSLFIPLPAWLISLFLVSLIIFTMVFFSYKKLALIFRWLTLPLLAYIGSALLAGLNFPELLKSTFLPRIDFDKTTLITLCAILGTTISPYLFFWQASEEVEEKRLHTNHPLTISRQIKAMRLDVVLGMIFSNLVMYFIIASGAATFHERGLFDIHSLEEATRSLVPIAGPFAVILFALGILGTGVLALPVLAGSAAYVVCESFGWPEGLNRSFKQSSKFYATLIISIVLGFLLSLLKLDPVQLLFYTALIYGLVSPILIGLILFIANNRELMGVQTNGKVSNLLNLACLVIMAVVSLGLFF